ncbi:hypothetical protein MMC30_008889 [Trapelia coarctata]|nr:hypothetical protein [Trapelia coarctata]
MLLSAKSLLLAATAMSGILTSVAGDLHPYGQLHGMQRREAYPPGAISPYSEAMANSKRGLTYELDERDMDSGWELGLVEREASDYIEFVERDLDIQRQGISKRALSKRDLFSDMGVCANARDACMAKITVTGTARNTAAAACNTKYEDCLKKLVDDRSRKIRLGAKGKNCSICREQLKVLESNYKSGCKHYSHPECMKGWVVNIHSTCPECRNEMRKREEFEYLY